MEGSRRFERVTAGCFALPARRGLEPGSAFRRMGSLSAFTSDEIYSLARRADCASGRYQSPYPPHHAAAHSQGSGGIGKVARATAFVDNVFLPSVASGKCDYRSAAL